jgi:hypothetical protein
MLWYEISYPSRLEGGFLHVESDEDITDRKRTEKQHNRKKKRHVDPASSKDNTEDKN